MKIGMNTDSLAMLPFDEVLDHAARLGLDMIEICCGGWSNSPHIDVARMVESEPVRRELQAKLRDHGVSLSALNASGNPLQPSDEGRKTQQMTRDTIRLASQLGVDRVVMMSGCPGGPGGGTNSIWVTTQWPPEVRETLRWQWDEVLIPYWRDLVAYANNLGIRKLCLELHGWQNVYSVQTLNRLRDAVGDTVGANFDPSHLMWMGADPIAAVRACGEAIYHVHAKDTRVEPAVAGINGVIDVVHADHYRQRAWNYVTLGYGHGEEWWRQFCGALAQAGYDHVLSMEHEDTMMSPIEGIEKSVRLLEQVVLNRPRRAAAE